MLINSSSFGGVNPSSRLTGKVDMPLLSLKCSPGPFSSPTRISTPRSLIPCTISNAELQVYTSSGVGFNRQPQLEPDETGSPRLITFRTPHQNRGIRVSVGPNVGTRGAKNLPTYMPNMLFWWSSLREGRTRIRVETQCGAQAESLGAERLQFTYPACGVPSHLPLVFGSISYRAMLVLTCLICHRTVTHKE